MGKFDGDQIMNGGKWGARRRSSNVDNGGWRRQGSHWKKKGDVSHNGSDTI